MKTKIAPTLRLQDLEENLEVTADQIADLDLSKLPPRVRLRIKRPDGIVEIQHIGKKLHVRLHADVAFDKKVTSDHYQAVYDLWEAALGEARFLLHEGRRNDPLYASAFNPTAILVPPSTTGDAALLALDNAVGTLIAKAHELLESTAGGISMVYSEHIDLI